MTNLEKFIEVMNETFNAKFKPENMVLECCPCGALKQEKYACRHFKCDGCKRWWHKEYQNPKEAKPMDEFEYWRTVEPKMDIVREKLGREELLAQMAEECSELAKAALKLRRVLDGTNPTPVTLDAAEENLQEEIADVIGCCLLLKHDVEACKKIFAEKMARWVKRLEARDNGNA